MSLPAITANLSPMMKQYIEIKRQHEDKLLFYRLGDFYELFFDDAKLASRELELVLTGRDCGLSERAPMCGVPFHSYEGYVAKLIARGYKVAICEQAEDPALAKGLVRREVVRVVTPGTVTESSMLNEDANNYICCLFLAADGFGLAAADISTGTVQVTESGGGGAAAVNEIARFAPRELLCNAAGVSDGAVAAFASNTLAIKPLQLYDANFGLERCKTGIAERFDDGQLVGLWNFRMGYAVCALGALVGYLADTQFHGVTRLAALETYRVAQYMTLTASCRRNLELTATLRGGEKRGSLLWVLDHTKTAMGRRLLRAFLDKPLLDTADINRRLDAVGELYEKTVELLRLRETLGGVYDIERLMTRVTYRTATPRDLVALADTGVRIAEMKALCGGLEAALAATLRDSLDPLDDVAAHIRATIAEDPPAFLKDGGYIRAGFDPEIDELRELLGNSKSYLARMESDLREKTGIKSLKVGYNRVFGYYIEVSKGSADQVPDDFIRRQTLTNGERYINDELKELESKILSASGQLEALERRHYDELLTFAESHIRRVQITAGAAAYLDVLCCFAALAREKGYCRPQVDGGGIIDIKGGRHPVVETVLNDQLFVPNDTLLDTGANLINIVTGPNMAGKSTYMRQTALIVIMAQMGCFVPAVSARIGVADAVFTRVGATDDLFSGDSTFMVEMKEVAEILANATSASLIILDEVGRGTSTYDGMSIARAVIEYIGRPGGIRAKTMFATHYHELTDLEHDFENVKNYSVAVKRRGDDITFLRRIVRGPADDSYGIEVARLAGLPEQAVARAKEILAGLENVQCTNYNVQIRSASSEQVGRDDPDAPQTDSIAKCLMEALAAIKIESLTPIEAMYKLDELKRMAETEEMTNVL